MTNTLHLGDIVALGDRHLLTVHLRDLLAGLGGVSLAAGRRLYFSLGYHWLGGRGLVIVGLRRVGLDMELHMRIIVQVVVSLVLM